MSITDTMWLRCNIMHGGHELSTETALKALLNKWELIWMQNQNLEKIYRERAGRVSQVRLQNLSQDSRHQGTRTQENNRRIFIVYDKNLPNVNVKIDDIHRSLTAQGQLSGVHDMAAALLMEMGNCYPDTAPKIKQIRQRFYKGEISLQEAGILIAEVESAGMIDYIKLMQAIPPDERPYQSNRDVIKCGNATTPRQFAEIFATTPHDRTAAGGATSLTSGETYALETVTGATEIDLEACVNNIGVKLMGLNLTGKTKWKAIVSSIKTRCLPLSSSANRSSFYQACSGVIYFLQKSGAFRGGVPMEEWLFTGKMRRTTSPILSVLPFSEFKKLIIELQTALGGGRTVLRDDQIRGCSAYAYIRIA